MFFFFKHKTAYDMRISDWSSDVCSSDLRNIAGQSLLFWYDLNKGYLPRIKSFRDGHLKEHRQPGWDTMQPTVPGRLRRKAHAPGLVIGSPGAIVSLAWTLLRRRTTRPRQTPSPTTMRHNRKDDMSVRSAQTNHTFTAQIGKAQRREKVCNKVK